MRMSQASHAIILDKSSPPMMFNAGDGFHYERLPEGTRVIYPPDPVEPLTDPNVAIERALLSPMEMEPLHELLFSDMKLTIAFDDISLPLPPMQRPDIRQLIIEKILEKAYARGVEDIHLIAALGLHRRMTEGRAYGTAWARKSWAASTPRGSTTTMPKTRRAMSRSGTLRTARR